MTALILALLFLPTGALFAVAAAHAAHEGDYVVAVASLLTAALCEVMGVPWRVRE